MGYTFGDNEWGGWDAAPGENPADCLGGNPKATDVLSTITDGNVINGAIKDGAISDGNVTDGNVTDGAIKDGGLTYGDTTFGAVSPTGPIMLFVNDKLLPITPAVVPAA